MSRKLIIVLSLLVTAFLLLVFACNIIVVIVSKGKCYDDIDIIPHHKYGILLGTGRSNAPSPYYDARIQATVDLYNAGKIDSVIISGENLYDDYFEVDSMVIAMKVAGVPIRLIDPYGTDTYTSLRRIKTLDDYRKGDITIISQHFHNQQAIFYSALIFEKTLIAYDAVDTDIWYWNVWRFVREALARTKAVLMLPFIY